LGAFDCAVLALVGGLHCAVVVGVGFAAMVLGAAVVFAGKALVPQGSLSGNKGSVKQMIAWPQYLHTTNWSLEFDSLRMQLALLCCTSPQQIRNAIEAVLMGLGPAILVLLVAVIATATAIDFVLLGIFSLGVVFILTGALAADGWNCKRISTLI
jgi:hypothetical protein